MPFRLFKKKISKTTPGKLVQVLNSSSVDLFLDVGANVGQTGRSLRDAGYRGRILSFEPVPSAYAALQQAAAADPLWTVAPPMAIGDCDGEITLNVSEASDMSSALEASDALMEALPKTEVREKLTVVSRRLDSILPGLLEGAASVFLKIDTQGFERSVLNGAPETLNVVKGVQMELSLFSLYKGEETYLSFLQDLHGLGMEPHMIVETNFSKTLRRQLQIDVVFMRG
ncbi:FkbM family methyltransferase [Pelagibius sp. Alg239-R121]|uniref:FkbM family methyltransferase n=1 Tax=Pelagibius sp. Alg239-R121 TaxID=2993448 RepID=UPI0024A658A2|nr:FkbM family methyltransferase [Pelagibius sp. Alg239-R121]